MLSYWEVVNAHQLLQSSLQRLTNNAGAANASAKPSTVSSTGSQTTRCRRDNDDQQEQERRMAPLVASIDKLAASVEMRRMEQKLNFEQICELRDPACPYRQERIQLDSKGEILQYSKIL